MNLITADSVPAVDDLPERGKPFLERDRGVLENSSELDGELAAALAAFPAFLSLEVVRLLGGARRAFWAFRPAHPSDGVNADLFIAVVLDDLLEGLLG